jgi:hypothetical protein
MVMNEHEWSEKLRGLIIRDVSISHPSFFRNGYVRLVVEDPKTEDQFSAKILLG